MCASLSATTQHKSSTPIPANKVQSCSSPYPHRPATFDASLNRVSSASLETGRNAGSQLPLAADEHNSPGAKTSD